MKCFRAYAVLAGVALAVTLSGCGDQTALAAQAGASVTTEECGAVSKVSEVGDFTPHEMRRTQEDPQRVLEVGAVDSALLEANDLPASINEMPAESTDVFDDTVLVLYSGSDPKGMTSSEFWGASGLQLESYPNASKAGLAADLRSQLEERATIVHVGPYSAALTWADPDAKGLRPHYLSWTGANDTNYVLSSLVSAEELVATARSIVC